MIQRYVGPPVTCGCSCRWSWISQPGHQVAGCPGGPQLPFFSATGMPHWLPLPICAPLLSSCDLLARPVLPFSPSPSRRLYVAAPVPPLTSATRTEPSRPRSAAVDRFSLLVREFADPAPPQIVTHCQATFSNSTTQCMAGPTVTVPLPTSYPSHFASGSPLLEPLPLHTPLT